MCTLAVAFRHAAGYPLVVAANRDEALGRPSIGPLLWPQGFLAPRDEQAHGTWLGLTKRGLFVGITNRFAGPRETDRRSRGTLVVEALEAGSAKAAHQHFSTLDAKQYNGFHLLYADRTDAFVTWGDGDALHQLELRPGLHVVTERSFGGDEPRAEVVRQAWPDGVEPEKLMSLLRLKGKSSPLDGTYVHAQQFDYGTKSSLVYLQAEDETQSRFYWAEGPPPSPPPFVDQTKLLAALRG